VEEVKPAVVFLMETRLDRERALGLKRKLGFANGEAVSSNGLSGGICFFGGGILQWLFRVFSKFHIDVLLSCPDLGIHQWRLTSFYGEPRRELRKNSWYVLRFLRGQLDSPWICLGDFNEVLSSDEHFGANEREH
jgi:hypothetical protein